MRGKIVIPMILALVTGCSSQTLNIPPVSVPVQHQITWPEHHVSMVFTVRGLGKVDIYYGSNMTAKLVRNVTMPWSGSEPYNANYANWFVRAYVQGKGYARAMIWVYDTIDYESGQVKHHNIGVVAVGRSHKHKNGFASVLWEADLEGA
jgi:hypothetical protein